MGELPSFRIVGSGRWLGGESPVGQALQVPGRFIPSNEHQCGSCQDVGIGRQPGEIGGVGLAVGQVGHRCTRERPEAELYERTGVLRLEKREEY